MIYSTARTVKHIVAGISLATASLVMVLPSYAEVPVVDSTPYGRSGGQAAPARGYQGGNGAALFVQLEELQQEVLSLRGLVEQQAYLIKRMQQEQKDRYIDLDRRISDLASSGGSVSGSKNAGVQQPVDASATSDKEKDEYNSAFQLIRQKRFDDALTALKAFVQTYPSGAYTDNAYYWQGEVYLAQNQLEPAKDAFTQVINKFPQSSKLPGAIYKLGRVYFQLGDKKQAKHYLEKVTKEFPDAAAANLAAAFLKQVN
ncbi:tol-pal system protein YbgF [Zooshikella ganghwensis]|uniref:tol-pal system protein YbgF n=1 Tax=Zooshikella ganghwensis TaxID=202772 RepID=UPI0004223E64|nr:tol-pal system protein YbgF [Zooshikella ganghwensis]